MQREPAWRLFADEFNRSTLSFQGEEEYSPTYVVTPLGARVNRLFVVGVLTDVENRGRETPFWHARVADMGSVYRVSCGQYQPEVSRFMEEFEAERLERPEPPIVALVGKARSYEADDGRILNSVRVEHLREVDERAYHEWILDTCRLTAKRLGLMKQARELDSPSVGRLEELGATGSLAQGIMAALEHYDPAFQEFEDSLLAALNFLSTPPAVGVDDEGGEEEALLLQIISRLEEGAPGGAPLDDVYVEAEKGGLAKARVDELLGYLDEDGAIYEPIIGKLKTISD